MASTRKRRLTELAIAVGVTIGLMAWILWPLLAETLAGKRWSEAEVHDFIGKLTVGQTPADVTRVFDTGRYRKMRVQSKTPAEWRIATPSQIGGSEWLVRLYFEDGRLRTIRVGSADRIDVTPFGAPPPRTH
jgi:hypothetical protein